MYPSGVLRTELTEGDVASVVSLQTKVMPNSWSPQAFKSSMKAGDGCYTLVSNGQIIAVAVVSQVLDEAELLTIAVASSEHGKGLATMLLKDLLAVLKSQSAKQCMLEVIEGNTAAIALYHRAGFQEVAKRKAYYKTDQGVFDALVMRLDL